MQLCVPINGLGHGKNPQRTGKIGAIRAKMMRSNEKFTVAYVNLVRFHAFTIRPSHHNPLVVVAVSVAQRLVALGDGAHLVEHRVGDVLLLHREGVSLYRGRFHRMGLDTTVVGAAEHGPAVSLLVQYAAIGVIPHPTKQLAVKPDLGQTVQPVVSEALFHAVSFVFSCG